MVYDRQLITPPSVDPIGLEEVKAHCRVDFTDDDGYLTGRIKVAATKLQNECARAFVTQSWEIYPRCFPCENFIKLPLGKLQAITSFDFTGADGTESEWTVDGVNLRNASNVIVAHIETQSDIGGRIVLAYNQRWPIGVFKTSVPITIGFDCGYGLANAVPSPLKHAMLLLVEHYYRNRDIAVVGKSVTMVELPRAVDDLITEYRLY